jgi:hypothetical protein
VHRWGDDHAVGLDHEQVGAGGLEHGVVVVDDEASSA